MVPCFLVPFLISPSLIPTISPIRCQDVDQGGEGLNRPGTLEGGNDEHARYYTELHNPLSDLIIRFVLSRQAVPAKPGKVL